MATKQHSTITGSDLHVPKAHVSSHYSAGADALGHSNLSELDYASAGHTGFSPDTHTHTLDSVLTAGDTSAANNLTLSTGTLTANTITDTTFSTTSGVFTGIASLDGAGTIDLEDNLDGTGFTITAGTLTAGTLGAGSIKNAQAGVPLTISGLDNASADGDSILIRGGIGQDGYDGGDVTLRGGADFGAGTAGAVVIDGRVDWTGITGNIGIGTNNLTTTGTVTSGGFENTSSSSLYNSINNSYTSVTSDELNATDYTITSQASGGGGSTILVGSLGRSHVSGGTFNHAIGVLGWQYIDATAIAGSYYGTEGRVDNLKLGSVGRGIFGITSMGLADNDGSTNYGGFFQADNAAGVGTGLNIGIYSTAQDGLTNYNAWFGEGQDSGDNALTRFAGYITDGAAVGYVDVSVDDTNDEFLFNVTDAKIDSLGIKLRDTAGVSKVIVRNSSGTNMAQIDSYGVLTNTRTSLSTTITDGIVLQNTTIGSIQRSPSMVWKANAYNAADYPIQWYMGTANNIGIGADFELRAKIPSIASDIVAIGFNYDGIIYTYNKIAFTQTDGNEYIDSLNDGYIDIGATTGVRINSALINTPDEITATSEGVAASITTVNTEVTTNGDSDLDIVTLANGVSGQMKHIYCVVSQAGDTWKITPATMCGGTQITFGDNSAGTGCTLVYADNEGWVVVANNGGTIA